MNKKENREMKSSSIESKGNVVSENQIEEDADVFQGWYGTPSHFPKLLFLYA